MSTLLIFIGSLFVLITAIGLVKFDDPINRAHALSKALTLGIALILLGLIPYLSGIAESIKVAFAILFLVITLPLSGHLLARYVYSQGN